ncbi:MAG: thioesterase [Rhodobacterales bacterium]|nr:MAG: thioesterase [Rhodobacterales bacterium]
MFTRSQKVLFKHCDPAGIVFYPRYFEMINDTVEAYFEERLDYPFHELIPAHGVPTVAIDTEFHAPSRHGDALVISLVVTRVGHSSVTLKQQALCGAEPRFTTTLTLVHVDQSGSPQAWPEPVVSKMRRDQEGTDQ